jgi:benzoate-CoA ligase
MTELPVAPSPPDRLNFARHLLEINACREDALAFLDDRSSLSYAELSKQIRRFGSGLLNMGIRAGDRVLLVMPDQLEWPVAFLGSMYAGLVPVPVNTLLTAGDYAHAIEHSGAAVVIGTAPLTQHLRKACGLLGSSAAVRLFVTVESLPDEDFQSMAFTRVLAAGDETYCGADTKNTDIAFWLYSSGSTGRPKGVVHSHANLFWTAELYGKPVMGLKETDRVFSAAKLFFAYGLGNALTFPLSVGATSILMAERPTPAAVLERLHRHQATIFCGAPTLYASLVALGTVERPAHLRLCTSAGEALPREVGVRFAAQYGIDILDGLGSTEMLHIFVSNRVDNVQYGTTGVPVEGYEVQLRGEQGNLIAGFDEIGDLWVKGPSAAMLYWNDEAKTHSTFQNGWVRTGDKYSRRPDERWVYAGRNDDMLKISGQYVSPFEVESTLVQHPGVLECAVIAVSDLLGIYKSKAYVVLRPGCSPSAEVADELRAFVRSRLAPFKRPHFVEFVLELPKTATGKIQRYRLRERAIEAPTQLGL